jgi:hypothetical protein
MAASAVLSSSAGSDRGKSISTAFAPWRLRGEKADTYGL